MVSIPALKLLNWTYAKTLNIVGNIVVYLNTSMKGLWGHHSHSQIVWWKHHLHSRSLCGQNFTITIDTHTHTHTKECTKLGLRLLPEWFLGVRYLRYFRIFLAFFLQTGMAWYVWMLTIRAALQTRKSFERSTKRRYKARGCYSVHFF